MKFLIDLAATVAWVIGFIGFMFVAAVLITNLGIIIGSVITFFVLIAIFIWLEEVQ